MLRSYLAEAKWRNEGYVPTVEEYLQVSLISSGYPMVTTTSFLSMGKVATTDAFGGCPMTLRLLALSLLCRLMNDIHGVSEEETVKLFREEIANAWKDINEEWLKPTPAPMPLLERIMNLARAMDVIYKDGDGFTNSYILKDYVASLLKDPVL
ncbi:hypothetical protein GH714_008516 [Hevea brasiliensis]|uniref:Terpene synthase metal-binding domain-containing protein n=1 Tax=Hevea brasiliensis TaxID=3981 RepID=A0A6A6KCL2_HEVBR|nr:hypothetical protein GH714_008516 [Hevea brasiliensis]